MFEVSPTHPKLPTLFDREIPNHPILLSTLLGNTPGRAWVDDPDQPTQCIVRIQGMLVFLSRDVNQAFLEEGLDLIKKFSHVLLVWRQGTSSLQIPKADRSLQRIEFAAYDSGNQNVAQIIKSDLPAGFEIRAMDKELVEKSEARDELESYCGSLENFLAHGFGTCLINNGEIISEAYTPFAAREYVELGIATKEAHRGHGYAALTCAHFMEACRNRGLSPYWSCDADNEASLRLARKLGFQQERAYDIQMYRGTPA